MDTDGPLTFAAVLRVAASASVNLAKCIAVLDPVLYYHLPRYRNLRHCCAASLIVIATAIVGRPRRCFVGVGLDLFCSQPAFKDDGSVWAADCKNIIEVCQYAAFLIQDGIL